MKNGFYIGTFHNNEGLYIGSVRVTSKLEVFEVFNNYGEGEVVYRIDDMFCYQYIDFLNPVLLDEAPDMQSLVKDKLVEDQYYWIVQWNSIKWEVVQIIKTVRNQFRFKKIGLRGTFELTSIKHLGPLIDLKNYHTAAKTDKTEIE